MCLVIGENMRLCLYTTNKIQLQGEREKKTNGYSGGEGKSVKGHYCKREGTVVAKKVLLSHVSSIGTTVFTFSLSDRSMILFIQLPLQPWSSAVVIIHDVVWKNLTLYILCIRGVIFFYLDLPQWEVILSDHL